MARCADTVREDGMELRDALTQISESRPQMARTEVFRRYRALPVAFSGLLAGAAAVYQAIWLPDPKIEITRYLVLWLGAALISVVAAGTEMFLRDWRTSAAFRKEI